MSKEGIHEAVQDAYARAARCPAGCGGENRLAHDLYDEGDRTSLPEGALAAALGCANPTALADLRAGERVLDLGSGGGVDVLLSARRVGRGGFVYGLDMTPEMLELAERNAAAAGVRNVQFLQGRMEQIPLPDDSVDVVLSNCAVNLSPDKPAVLAEAHRVLRPDGRLAIADVATRGPLPQRLRDELAAWAGCVAGVLEVEGFNALLTEAGFEEPGVEIVRSFGRADVELVAATALAELRLDALPEDELAAAEGQLVSVFVRARKRRARAIPEIARHELHRALADGSVVALDAQGAGWYERQHLPGAVRARPDDLAGLEHRLPRGKDTPLAVYCWSEACIASRLTADHLATLGYRNVRRYPGGKRDWIEAGLPLEGEEA